MQKIREISHPRGMLIETKINTNEEDVQMTGRRYAFATAYRVTNPVSENFNGATQNERNAIRDLAKDLYEMEQIICQSTYIGKIIFKEDTSPDIEIEPRLINIKCRYK